MVRRHRNAARVAQPVAAVMTVACEACSSLIRSTPFFMKRKVAHTYACQRTHSSQCSRKDITHGHAPGARPTVRRQSL